MSKLSDEEVHEALKRLPGWRFADGELVKSYKLGSFMDAIAFINRIAERAEEADHHPDLTNHYNRVRVALHTWTENGVTDKDVALAREIEAAAGAEAETADG